MADSGQEEQEISLISIETDNDFVLTFFRQPVSNAVWKGYGANCYTTEEFT